MLNNLKSNSLTHVVVVVFCIVISYIYFAPLLEGKRLYMNDIANYKGMAKEIDSYRERTGKEALWTNSMFGGMPAFLVSVKYKMNLFDSLQKLISVGPFPAGTLIVTLLGFYLALLLFGLDPNVGWVGAIAFSFSSYFFIIAEAGHTSKAIAIGYMAPVIAGFYYAYRKNLLVGAAVFGWALAFQISANHPQITYYTAIILLWLIFFLVYDAAKEHTITAFVKNSIVLFFVGLLAVGTSAGRLWGVYEYGKYSMRGGSELTDTSGKKTASGLDKDYITAWSYGIKETMTLLVPNAVGSSSHAKPRSNSKVFQALDQHGYSDVHKYIKMLPMYFGSQPFTSGPVYFGAIVIFLFVCALFVVRGWMRWWVVSVTVLSIMLAWGRNFMFLTDLFILYFPGYTKFRTVSMILTIANVMVPLYAFYGLYRWLHGEGDNDEKIKVITKSLYIVGSIVGLLILFPGIMGSMTHGGDQSLVYQMFGNNVKNMPNAVQLQHDIVNALVEERKAMVRLDALRSLVFIVLAMLVLRYYVLHKIKYNYFILLLGILILIDHWMVDRRFLDNEDFIPKREFEVPYKPTRADEYILRDPDPNFRVLNLSVNTFNDASTSFFHKSIGGYHGAKMGRYQEIIERHISKNNMNVLNMLNTKYFIVSQQGTGIFPYRNPEALGNAWFVDSVTLVENADEEIAALSKFNPARRAIVDKRFASFVEGKKFVLDTTNFISFMHYEPNYLIYRMNCSSEQLAVFSEIYYPHGWQAYIDDVPAEHFRVNYILRAMIIPAGDHKIEFRFHPNSYYVGEKISLASSLLLLLFGGFVVFRFRNSDKKEK